MPEEEVEHVGTKTLALVVGIILSAVYALLKFFTTPSFDLNDLYKIALVAVFFGFVWTAILYLAQLFWKWMHGISEKIG
jgi:preprotein translocase subunit Sec61beta